NASAIRRTGAATSSVSPPTESARSRVSAHWPGAWRTTSSLRSTPSSVSRCTRSCSTWRRATSRAAPRSLPAETASVQGSQPGGGGGLEARQGLADQAVIDTGRTVLATGEDPVAGRTEARAGERKCVAAEVEQELARAGVPEAGGELARGDDPAAVRV